MRANFRRAVQGARVRTAVREARAELAEGDAPAGDVRSDFVVTEPPQVVMQESTVSRDDADVPHGLRIAAAWAWRIILLGLLGWAIIRVVGQLQLVVVPLTIALLLSALLAPAVGVLFRARVPRSLATAVVLVGGIAAVVATLTLVINQLIAGVPDLSSNTTKGIRQIQDWLRNGPLHMSDNQLDGAVTAAQRWLDEHTESLTSGAVSTAATVFEVLTGALLVLFATFFFLRDGKRIWSFIVTLLPRGAREHVHVAGYASWVTLGSYVRATVLVAFIDAVGIGLALVILRVPFAFPLAALVFIGAFIPIVGATVSGVVAVLIALVGKGWVTALMVLLAVIAVQQLEGHVLQPIIMGRAVAIHPLAVIVAITTGVVLAGIVGALVAVPLVAVLNTGVRRLAARAGAAKPPPDPVVAAAEPPG
ncbi:AI-2E family transporter [Rhizomonospora bruguierae]|uniref:AI-2E family transporter n=1 Tax=Rhizomonospora bruguierae TaxID=1581705 RepID=UPI001BCDCAE7|nr:AI-2E family transporter [Micromonospora sp. NBRC 107566]